MSVYANNGWLRRPGPWPGAEAVTADGILNSKYPWIMLNHPEWSGQKFDSVQLLLLELELGPRGPGPAVAVSPRACSAPTTRLGNSGLKSDRK